ncbi:MAG: nicotinate-nucleotide adenylyltransferase [Legionellales bacterium]
MHSIAIFGGTFDPIHNGHIQTSINIQNTFHFDRYYFLPCKAPVLKSPSLANSEQRIAMLNLAIKPHPEFQLDLREIHRESPSYMVDTLESLRTENPTASVTLIIGHDAFLSLPQWHHWEKIPQLANLLVINRAELSRQKSITSEAIKKLLKNHQTKNKTDLLMSLAGSVVLFDAGNYTISSTLIREEIKQEKMTSGLLPDEVCNYIKQLQLYQ